MGADRIVSIRADFAEALVFSYAGGVNELEVGGLCVSKEAADRLASKIEAALADLDPGQRDITLRLDRAESLVLGVASQNCEAGGLPAPQSAKVDAYFEEWRRSELNRRPDGDALRENRRVLYNREPTGNLGADGNDSDLSEVGA